MLKSQTKVLQGHIITITCIILTTHQISVKQTTKRLLKLRLFVFIYIYIFFYQNDINILIC